MTSALSRLTRLLMVGLLLALSVTRPALAADDDQPSVLRDAETERLFRDISAPLIRGADLDPKNVEVVLLNSTTINAFVDRGQRVYIYSGLLLQADSVNELQGVIAHELGHVAGGHGIRLQQGTQEATGITIATMILGALAMAAGAGDAGVGIMMAGQRAALGRLLAFSRTQESSADQAGAKYLSAAGVTGRGATMISFAGVPPYRRRSRASIDSATRPEIAMRKMYTVTVSSAIRGGRMGYTLKPLFARRFRPK